MQRWRIRSYGLKYAAVELPLSLSTDPKLSMPSPRICSPGWRSFPRNWIRGLPSKSSFSQEQGELLALEWFSLSNVVDDGRI
jgi:hypothetical protein